MVHRPPDTRLLNNLITNELSYSKHLHSLLTLSSSSQAAFSAYASASSQDLARVIVNVAACLSGADDALADYAGAVDEWRDGLARIKSAEEELGLILRDREIFVTRLLKASKPQKANRDSLINLGLSNIRASLSETSLSSPSHHPASSPSSSTQLTKLATAQAELQACEGHLARKELELEHLRSSIVRQGLEGRLRALIRCAEIWRVVGGEGLGVLGFGGHEKVGMANGHALPLPPPPPPSPPSSLPNPHPSPHAPQPYTPLPHPDGFDTGINMGRIIHEEPNDFGLAIDTTGDDGDATIRLRDRNGGGGGVDNGGAGGHSSDLSSLTPSQSASQIGIGVVQLVPAVGAGAFGRDVRIVEGRETVYFTPPSSAQDHGSSAHGHFPPSSSGHGHLPSSSSHGHLPSSSSHGHLPSSSSHTHLPSSSSTDPTLPYERPLSGGSIASFLHHVRSNSTSGGGGKQVEFEVDVRVPPAHAIGEYEMIRGERRAGGGEGERERKGVERGDSGDRGGGRGRGGGGGRVSTELRGAGGGAAAQEREVRVRSSGDGVSGPSASAYSGPLASAYTGPSTGSNAGPSASTYGGPLASATAGPSTSAYTGPSASAYTGPSASAYTGPSANAYTGPSASAYTGPSASAYTGPSASAYTRPKASSPLSKSRHDSSDEGGSSEGESDEMKDGKWEVRENERFVKPGSKKAAGKTESGGGGHSFSIRSRKEGAGAGVGVGVGMGEGERDERRDSVGFPSYPVFAPGPLVVEDGFPVGAGVTGGGGSGAGEKGKGRGRRGSFFGSIKQMFHPKHKENPFGVPPSPTKEKGSLGKEKESPKKERERGRESPTRDKGGKWKTRTDKNLKSIGRGGDSDSEGGVGEEWRGGGRSFEVMGGRSLGVGDPSAGVSSLGGGGGGGGPGSVISGAGSGVQKSGRLKKKHHPPLEKEKPTGAGTGKTKTKAKSKAKVEEKDKDKGWMSDGEVVGAVGSVSAKTRGKKAKGKEVEVKDGNVKGKGILITGKEKGKEGKYGELAETPSMRTRNRSATLPISNTVIPSPTPTTSTIKSSPSTPTLTPSRPQQKLESQQTPTPTPAQKSRVDGQHNSHHATVIFVDEPVGGGSGGAALSRDSSTSKRSILSAGSAPPITSGGPVVRKNSGRRGGSLDIQPGGGGGGKELAWPAGGERSRSTSPPLLLTPAKAKRRSDGDRIGVGRGGGDGGKGGKGEGKSLMSIVEDVAKLNRVGWGSGNKLPQAPVSPPPAPPVQATTSTSTFGPPVSGGNVTTPSRARSPEPKRLSNDVGASDKVANGHADEQDRERLVLHRPVRGLTPLKSALRNPSRTPSPGPIPLPKYGNGGDVPPVPNLPDHLRDSAAGGGGSSGEEFVVGSSRDFSVERGVSGKRSPEDSASISSYETGHEVFDEDEGERGRSMSSKQPSSPDPASRSPPRVYTYPPNSHNSTSNVSLPPDHAPTRKTGPAPPPPPRSPARNSVSMLNHAHPGQSHSPPVTDLSTSTASTYTQHTQTGSDTTDGITSTIHNGGPPPVRKTVRVSLEPTFSPTPPAIYDDDEDDEHEGREGRYAPWSGDRGVGDKGKGKSQAWKKDADQVGDMWEDSSEEEDEEYRKARKMLSRVGEKF